VDCVVCGSPSEGDVRLEGVASRRVGVPDEPGRRAWVWGPVPVHEACRPALATPYDGQLGVPEAAVCGAEYLVAATEVAPAPPRLA
jgi:hypothetical protein